MLPVIRWVEVCVYVKRQARLFLSWKPSKESTGLGAITKRDDNIRASFVLDLAGIRLAKSVSTLSKRAGEACPSLSGSAIVAGNNDCWTLDKPGNLKASLTIHRQRYAVQSSQKDHGARQESGHCLGQFFPTSSINDLGPKF